MTKWTKRKDIEKIFLPFTQNGKQIWVIHKVKQIPDVILKMTFRLAELDFIRYIRIGENSLSASSENYPNRPKVPITKMNHETAIGIQILYDLSYKYVDFFDINSPIKGNGSKMVEAILKDFPIEWSPSVSMDWSNGFWDRMKEKYNNLDWIM